MGSRETVGQLRDGKMRSKFALPEPGKVRTFIVTSAQNNTYLHMPLWNNLLAYAKERDAELLVSTFTYRVHEDTTEGSKTGERTFVAVAPSRPRKTSRERPEKATYSEWWIADIEPYILDQSVELAPGLVWCGELQILPTAVDPLSGFDSYTGRASSIIPHPKFEVKSVPSPKYAGTKFLWTTGTVTLRHYIQKKAGQKASFHHGYGALIVEVDSEGAWFVRQLNADSEGVFYDLGRRVAGGQVTYGHQPEALVWGDIHVHWLEDDMETFAWGERGLLDQLRPRCQVFHDVLDFYSQKHHDRDDHFKRYEKYEILGTSIGDELREAACFLSQSQRPWCRSVVVASNHDDMLVRWLRDAEFREDPENAQFFLRATLATYMAIGNGDDNFYPVEWAFKNEANFNGRLDDVVFLRRDDRFIACPDAHGGIELGMHGDIGLNGGRGDIKSFARTGRKCIVGHGHGAGQYEGAMQVGVMGRLDQKYNVGMSNWSHTNALVYPNGKRTLFTIWRSKDGFKYCGEK